MSNRIRCFSLLTILSLACISSAQAMRAGDYYYFISERCEPRGPQEPEQKAAVTPDVRLFDIVPAGISDYYVKMNTSALADYPEEGQRYLDDLAKQQAYTAGESSDNPQETHHDFMLQREAIDLAELIRTLNVFSQRQSDTGYFYKKLLTLSDDKARFKAVTRVRLTETGVDNALYLTTFTSEYFKLDDNGSAAAEAFITVDHAKAITRHLHDADSPYAHFVSEGICAEKWVPANTGEQD
ncbi:hypothetical protein [Alteromonas sp. H39]|uniref:hypothetical protein n=1 Tax=Alteromonas sp. H39 TaxID=3389876 RepID=UPI0039E08F51